MGLGALNPFIILNSSETNKETEITTTKTGLCFN